MKINNPTTFSNEKLMSNKDITYQYSNNGIDNWHNEATTTDTWVRFSFDRGLTYPLKFSYQNDIMVKIPKEITEFTAITDATTNSSYVTSAVFSLSGYSKDILSAAKNGFVSLNFYDDNGWATNISDFKYFYSGTKDGDDQTIVSDPTLTVKLKTPASELESSFTSGVLSISLDGTTANLFAVTTTRSYSLTTALPTYYDETYGICNVLDDSNPRITCLTRLEKINKITLNVAHFAKASTTHDVVLNFKCGTMNISKTIRIEGNTDEVDVNFDSLLTGTLIIERDYNNDLDTLKEIIEMSDQNGVYESIESVLSLCITEIKLETV